MISIQFAQFAGMWSQITKRFTFECKKCAFRSIQIVPNIELLDWISKIMLKVFNVDFDDIYYTAFQDGYFKMKLQEEVMRRSKDEVEKLKFDMLVTQSRLEDMQRKLSLYT